MVRQSAIGLLFGALLIALWTGVPATAQDADPHTATDPACAHCHDDPHVKEGETAEPSNCASCHTSAAWSPSTFTLADHAKSTFPLKGKHADVACDQCHVDQQLTGLPENCSGCHIDRHRTLLGDKCEECHAVEAWKPVEDFNHTRSGFVLAGAHSEASCESCHKGANGRKLLLGAGGACIACHGDGHGDFGECGDCHQSDHASFADARKPKVFDHRMTGWPLERRHGAQACASCHPAAKSAPLTRCNECHTDPHAGQLGMLCEDCHRADRWRLARFDHDQTGWPLKGRHHVAPCSSCHTGERWVGLATECWDCHALDVGPEWMPGHEAGRVACGDCHNTWRW